MGIFSHYKPAPLAGQTWHDPGMSTPSGFTAEDLKNAQTRKQLIKIAKRRDIPYRPHLRRCEYESALRQLQAQLVNLQRGIAKKKMRVGVVVEGRGAAG